MNHTRKLGPWANKFVFIIGILFLAPIITVMALMDHTNGKGFKRNFKDMFAIDAWSEFKYSGGPKINKDKK